MRVYYERLIQKLDHYWDYGVMHKLYYQIALRLGEITKVSPVA